MSPENWTQLIAAVASCFMATLAYLKTRQNSTAIGELGGSLNGSLARARAEIDAHTSAQIKLAYLRGKAEAEEIARSAATLATQKLVEEAITRLGCRAAGPAGPACRADSPGPDDVLSRALRAAGTGPSELHPADPENRAS